MKGSAFYSRVLLCFMRQHFSNKHLNTIYLLQRRVLRIAVHFNFTSHKPNAFKTVLAVYLISCQHHVNREMDVNGLPQAVSLSTLSVRTLDLFSMNSE